MWFKPLSPRQRTINEAWRRQHRARLKLKQAERALLDCRDLDVPTSRLMWATLAIMEAAEELREATKHLYNVIYVEVHTNVPSESRSR